MTSPSRVSCNRHEETLRFLIINRHWSEQANLEINLTGFNEPSLTQHLVMEGYDLRATNTTG